MGSRRATGRSNTSRETCSRNWGDPEGGAAAQRPRCLTLLRVMASVGVSWAVGRAWLRRRATASVVLVVLIATGTGLGVAALTGARRTASAYGRVLEAAGAADVISSH